jgi:hypothetical protein
MLINARKIAVFCLILSVFRLLSRKLRVNTTYINTAVKMDGGEIYRIFRHITVHPSKRETDGILFIVSFKFARLSHRANKIASLLPMLLISGFPGFIQKLYAVNEEDGYWQGMYEWKSEEYLEAYKKSFVFRMMNKRAIPASIETMQYANQTVKGFIKKNKN